MTARDAAFFNDINRDRLPGLLGIRTIELNSEKSVLEMEVADKARNFSGSVHGSSMGVLPTCQKAQQVLRRWN